jgi:hypothetical protein
VSITRAGSGGTDAEFGESAVVPHSFLVCEQAFPSNGPVRGDYPRRSCARHFSHWVTAASVEPRRIDADFAVRPAASKPSSAFRVVPA